MYRRLAYGTLATLLSAGVLAGALAQAGWASTRAVRISAGATHVSLSVACPAATASPGCRITATLRTVAGGRVRAGMLVGRRAALVAPGNERRITIRLTALGRRLLHELARPRVAATVTSTPATPPPPTAPATTAPPTTATTPTSTAPCSPIAKPVPPLGPGPDAVGGIALTRPLDCVG